MISDAHKTIIAVIAIKFATSFTSDWGVISLYIFSYFHHYGSPIEMKPSTNSLMLIFVVVPVVLTFIISTKIAAKVGHVNLVKISAICYTIFPLISIIDFNFFTFLICNMIAPSVFFTSSFVPTFSCIYSHYEKNKSLATAIVIGSFSIGAVLWNLAVTLAINPENIIPDIASNDPNFKFFPKEVIDRVPLIVHLVYIISGAIFILGSFLINYNEQYIDSSHLPLPIHREQQSSQQPTQLQPKQQTSLQPKDQQPRQQAQSGLDRSELSVSQICYYLKHPIVVLVFFLNIFAGLFQIYIQLNTKIIYMPVLEDDHLISLGLMIVILSSALFSIPWGILSDRKGPFYAILLFILLDLGVKVYAALQKTKVGFLVSMALIGATDKTMFVLFAPIMIDAFGLFVTTQLLFLKGVSGIFAIIITSLIGVLLSNLPADEALLWMCGFNVLNIGLGIALVRILRDLDNKNKIEISNQVK